MTVTQIGFWSAINYPQHTIRHTRCEFRIISELDFIDFIKWSDKYQIVN